jgi:polyphosphate:AMP phosphotransferase
MDPRHIRVLAFGPPTPEEKAHPPAWRYWQALPPKGKLGIYMNAWYNETLAQRLRREIDDDELEARMAAIRQHERMLTDEGLVLLKFWIHLSKSAQRERMRELARNPLTRWRVTRDDRTRARIYAKSHDLWEQLLRETSTAEAPWYVVEGTDERYRSLTVGKILLGALERTLAKKKPPPMHTPTPPAPAVIDNVKLIRDLDLTQKVAEKKYDKGVERFQGELARLTRSKRFDEESLILVFEGADAAGKGGAIRRVTAALDARQYVTIPVAAPTEEERAHPYLWRFWRHVPVKREIVIFDRSWYGRVLVERVEGYCTPTDWMRAYDEINQFEEQLTDAGGIVVKFWLQISKAEQLRRFREREKTAFKRFKITPDDWRNRKKWDAYEAAVSDMVDRTSTEIAPWTLVEADDKYFARLKIFKTIIKRLEVALE